MLTQIHKPGPSTKSSRGGKEELLTLSISEAKRLLRILICSFSSVLMAWMLGSISRFRGARRLSLTVTAVIGAEPQPALAPIPTPYPNSRLPIPPCIPELDLYPTTLNPPTAPVAPLETDPNELWEDWLL